MLEVIYIARHGFRLNWTLNHTTGEYFANMPSPTGIPTDPALTAHGVEQSEELGEHLLTLEPIPDIVYSSPYYRCIQTIAPGAKRLFSAGKSGGKIKIENGVSEFFGHAKHFEHPSPAPLSELSEAFFPQLLDDSYSPLMVPTTQGETIESLHNRIAFVLHKLIEAADRDPKGPKAILICTHAAVMIAAGRVLTGRMPPDVSEEDFFCYTASLSTYRRKPTTEAVQIEHWNASEPDKVPQVNWRDGNGVAGGWVCEKNSDASYLSGGAERGWRFFGDESFIFNPNGFNDAKIEQSGKKDGKGSSML